MTGEPSGAPCYGLRVLETRAAGLCLGALADAALGDPRRHHPVALFGSWAAWLEDRLYADDVARGAVLTAAALAPLAALGAAAEQVSRRHPVAHVATTALATWAVLGARSLVREGDAMAAALAEGDLPAARERLTHLCSRDASAMTEPDLARATIESLAENTNDAAVASLLWGAALGVPGLLLHRGANTLDAMVGYKKPRYLRFGKVAALTDDALGWLPARATGALASAVAGTVGGSPRRAWRMMRRDHAHHPSPNGGWCEAAWAGALGVQLGGVNVYFGRTETRGLLGDGPRPGHAALAAASRLVTATTTAATVLAAGSLVARHLSGKDHR